MIRIELNVSGEIFQTTEKTLKRFPQTLLGNIKTRRHYFCSTSNQYFLDRNRRCFEAVLSFYQQFGRLRCPDDINIHIFEKECKFYRLPNDSIKKMKLEGGILPEMEKTDNAVDNEKPSTLREIMWNIFENPGTSRASIAYTLISFFAIISSIILLISESVKYLVFPWQDAELALNTFFIIELFLRFLCSPRQKSFLFDWLNFIDFIAITSYFMILIFLPDSVKSIGYLRIFRLVRVLRLMKLSKHSRRLQVVTLIVKMCRGDFAFLLLTVSLLMTLSSSVMFYLEAHDTGFLSIPHTFWWGIITLTTVGYGDVYPTTVSGKIFTGLVMVFGAMTISIPVLAIIANFERFYENNVSDENENEIPSSDGTQKVL